MRNVKSSEDTQLDAPVLKAGANPGEHRSRLAQWAGTILLFLVLSVPIRLLFAGGSVAVELAIVVLCAPAAWFLVSRFGHRHY